MGEAKRRRGAGGAGDPPTPDDDCLPMTAEALSRAMAVANAAMGATDGPDLSRHRAPLDLAFEVQGVGLTEDPAEAARRDVQTVAMTNTPDNRAAFAVLQISGNNQRRFASTMTRIYAALRRIEDEEARRWTRAAPGGGPAPGAVHRAVMETAGSMALKMGGDFDREGFWRAVEQRAAAMG